MNGGAIALTHTLPAIGVSTPDLNTANRKKG
jgi:hypothetical protein